MHIPDGVLRPEVLIATGAVSVAAVGVAAARARARLEDESIPLVGLLGAFVFALQMINFPIAFGVSDHIVGAGLLAIVFGPAIAVVAMAAIVTLQALLFGDGGVAALGANVLNMAVVSVLTAWVIHRALARTAPRSAVIVATLAGALAGALGATAEVMLSQPYGAKFLAAMALTHMASGLVEAVATLAVVKALAGAGLVRFAGSEAGRV